MTLGVEPYIVMSNADNTSRVIKRNEVDKINLDIFCSTKINHVIPMI